MLDAVKENIIEITMLYDRMVKKEEIQVEDSMNGKLAICDLAEGFEKLHKGTYWNGGRDDDYYVEIEKFARGKTDGRISGLFSILLI